MSAWQSMTSFPQDGKYYLVFRIGRNIYEQYAIIAWEDWDEPMFVDQEGQEVGGPFGGWAVLPKVPEAIEYDPT